MGQAFVTIAILLNCAGHLALAGSGFEPGLSEQILPTHYRVRELCPINQFCTTNGTLIDLVFERPCEASLSDFSYDSEEKGDQLHIYLQAEITYSSAENNCQGIVQETRRISLFNQFGNVVLHNGNPTSETKGNLDSSIQSLTPGVPLGAQDLDFFGRPVQ